MNVHVMLDLETWGTAKDAVIVSIGATKFDIDTPDIMPADIDKFHVGIAPSSSLTYGGTISASTILWWMASERREALDAWLALEKVDLATALEGFREWFGDKSLPVWGNGSTFDNVLLRSAYEHVGMEAPWSFRHDRDLRTIRGLINPDDVEDMRKTYMPDEVREGTAHDALHDALYQTYDLLGIVADLGLELK